MSILFDSHEDPTAQQQKKCRARPQQDERYPIPLTSDKHDDILMFGYQCKLFRDDQCAEEVNTGKFLIPWMGNKELMIDRYDCRGHLYKLEEFDFENMKEFEPLTPEILDVENVCDEQRYMDLKYDMSEESILQEEEDKRGSALYDPFTAYQNIEYSYEDSNTEGKKLSDFDSSSNTNNSNFDNDMYIQFCLYYGYDPNDSNLKSYFENQNCYQYDYERPPPPPEPPADSEPPVPVTPSASYEKFQPPKGIEIPDGMEVPETRKMQSIIEKTAMFISKQSAQMEIVLKTKQSGNPQFAFLDFDNYLNPYYKFILGKIKNNEYEYESSVTNANEVSKEESDKTVSVNENVDNAEDSDDDGNENELHPLLQAHRRPLNQNKAGTPPPEIPEVLEPIINPVSMTKMTGKVEDLAKVYMTWKYTPNPELQQNETVSDKEESEEEKSEPSLEGVEELPPPPPPPPTSFILPDLNEKSIDNTSSPEPPEIPLLPHILCQQDLEPSNEQIEQSLHINTNTSGPPPAPKFILQAQMTHPPQMPLHPPQLGPTFSQLRFPTPQIGQSHFPLQIGHGFFNAMPGNAFLPGRFPNIPHQLQYPHPELYQVRSSVVPPPPPPPFPSLMPPGVDAPHITTISTVPVSMEGTSLPIQEVAPVTTDSSMIHASISNQEESMESAPPPIKDAPLLPPGEEIGVSEKRCVPPPPPPPFLPSVDFEVKVPESTLNSNDTLEQNVTAINTFGQNDSTDINDKRLDDNFMQNIKSKIRRKKGKQRRADKEEFLYKKDIPSGNSTDDELNDKNKVPIQLSPSRRKHSPHYSDPPDSLDDHDLYVERKKKKVSSKSRNTKIKSRKSENEESHNKISLSLDTHIQLAPEYVNSHTQYQTEQSNYSQSLPNYSQLNLPTTSCQNISPFDQINQTLKSIQGLSGSSLSTSQNNSNSSVPTLPTKIVTPGKDLQLVIDRLALYVAKNGEEFEVGIKDKKDPRFDFLNPWNIYHPYYSGKKSTNLEEVEIEKRKEEERRRNLKVKFGLKAKVKPVNVAKEKAAPNTAAIFNQNDEDEINENPEEGFQPNKDPELEVKRRLQKQIEEKEKLLRRLHEQALLQQKIAEVNRQASSKPMLQNLTSRQQALLKRKVLANQAKKDSVLSTKQDERKKRAASFVGMLKKNTTETVESAADVAGNFLRKRHFKETSSNKGNNSEPPDKVNSDKKDAFFKAINDAFKGT